MVGTEKKRKRREDKGASGFHNIWHCNSGEDMEQLRNWN